MSSSAIDAQGTVLKVGDAASPEVFTTVPEVKSFQGPGGSAQVIDVTDLSSTAKEKRMGLQDEGQISATMNWIPGNSVHQGLRTDRTNQTLRNFTLTFADSPASVASFAAFVTTIQLSAGVDAVIEAQVTLEISGAVTWS